MPLIRRLRQRQDLDRFYLYDDFATCMDPGETLQYWGTAKSASSTVLPISDGSLEFHVANGDAAGFATLHKMHKGQYSVAKRAQMRGRFKLSRATDINCQIAFYGTAANALVMLTYDTQISVVDPTHWIFITDNASGNEKHDSGVVATPTVWHEFEIKCLASNKAELWLDGALICTNTTYIPTQVMEPSFTVSTYTTTGPYMYLDWIELEGDRL